MRPWQWVYDGQRVHWPRTLLVALTGTVLVALVVVGLTSTVVFGLYNPAWDGATDLREQLEADPDTDVELLSDASEYEQLDANETVVFLIAPEEQYTDADAEQVRGFVERGGTLVVLDNFATPSNALLAAVDAEARLDGRTIRDELNHFQAPTMPVADNVTDHPLTTGVEAVTFNHATAIEPGNATVLVATSEFAYLTTTPDGELDANVTLASYPVATAESVERGDIVVVGDPSLTINAMLGESDNAAFLNALYSGHDVAVIDISTHESVPPLRAALIGIRASGLAQVGIAALGILALAAVARGRSGSWVTRLGEQSWVIRIRRALRHESPTDDGPILSVDERARYLAEHDEYDEEQATHVMRALNHQDEKDENQDGQW